MLPVTRCDEYIYPVPKFDLSKGDVHEFSNELRGFHKQFADCGSDHRVSAKNW
jgi:hypothetical protein